MAANPASVSDIESRWRSLSAEEETVAASLLGDAWEILKARVPSLASRLDAAPPTLASALVVAVLSAMVLRVMQNPTGLRQESIDDYTWIRDNAVSSGLLYASDDELALLSPAGDTAAAFSIRPFGEPGYDTATPSPNYADWDWGP